MYKIKVNEKAVLDLNWIYNHLYEVTFSLDVSRNFVQKVYKKYLYLKLFPNMYQNTYKNFKTIQIKSYKIFYKVDEIKKIVTIYRILWASQNFKEYV
jgi:plasmid stabilization system protein ParE